MTTTNLDTKVVVAFCKRLEWKALYGMAGVDESPPLALSASPPSGEAILQHGKVLILCMHSIKKKVFQ